MDKVLEEERHVIEFARKGRAQETRKSLRLSSKRELPTKKCRRFNEFGAIQIHSAPKRAGDPESRTVEEGLRASVRHTEALWHSSGLEASRFDERSNGCFSWCGYVLPSLNHALQISVKRRQTIETARMQRPCSA